MKLTCVDCRQPIYFKPADKAEAPGHVYSGAGRDEVYISGLCEYCFDEITTGWEDEDEW